MPVFIASAALVDDTPSRQRAIAIGVAAKGEAAGRHQDRRRLFLQGEAALCVHSVFCSKNVTISHAVERQK